MLKYAAACIVLVALAGCQTTRDDELTVAEGAKKECRSITESGTILPKRVCHNKATWAEIEERDREAAKENMRTINDRYTPPPRDTGF